jgi:phosphoribosylformylglycinamidine synthase
VSAPVRVLVPVGFGFNCEDETAAAFRMVGAEVELVHLTDLFGGRAPRPVTQYQVVAFVGGFSYGDHVASGLVAATRIRAHLRQELSDFLAGGGRLIGICNGCQVLTRLGLLPGPEAGPPDFGARVALADNDRLGYRDAWVRLGVDRKSISAWTRGITAIEVPARHGEGKFVFESPEALDRLEHRGQVALRYLDSQGQPTETWPDNPNGSAGGVAALCDATGRVLGLMPHPEAFLYPWQHPDYSRRRKEIEAREPGGLAIFRAGVSGF